MSLPDHEAQTARSMLLCAAAALGAEARGAALTASVGKDGVATFAHALAARHFIAQPQGLQRGDDAHVFAHAAGFDGAVKLARLVADAHDHGSGAATVRVGLCLDEGFYRLVVGAWSCPLDELRLHGVFSGFDEALLIYLAKYLRKVCGDQGDIGDLAELCPSLHAPARNVSCAALRGAAH